MQASAKPIFSNFHFIDLIFFYHKSGTDTIMASSLGISPIGFLKPENIIFLILII